MREWIRRQVDQLCDEAGNLFTPTFGVTPSSLTFGQAPVEGVSDALARGDHEHGMPDAPTSTIDDLDQFTLFFDDLALTTPTNVFQERHDSIAIGGRDTTTGPLGAFGSLDVGTNNTFVPPHTSGIWLRNDTAVTLTARHLWQRTIRLAMRALIPDTVSELVSCKAWVGAIGAFAYGSTGAAIESALTDGVYFKLSTDGSGVGNWIASATNNSSTTTVDTGRPPVQNGSSIEFTTFQIDYDHPSTTAKFYIGDSTHTDAAGTPILDLVATISTNIPDSTRLLGGFGIWVQNGSALARTIALDYIFLKGFRVAPA